jgi:hypothetical protein
MTTDKQPGNPPPADNKRLDPKRSEGGSDMPANARAASPAAHASGHKSSKGGSANRRR